MGGGGNIGEAGECPPEAEAKETRRKQTQRELRVEIRSERERIVSFVVVLIITIYLRRHQSFCS